MFAHAQTLEARSISNAITLSVRLLLIRVTQLNSLQSAQLAAIRLPKVRLITANLAGKIPTNQTRALRPIPTITEPRLGHLRERKEPFSHTQRSRPAPRSVQKSQWRSNTADPSPGRMEGERMLSTGRGWMSKDNEMYCVMLFVDIEKLICPIVFSKVIHVT